MRSNNIDQHRSFFTIPTSIKQQRASLPVSRSTTPELRKRLSSLSALNTTTTPIGAAAWSFPRSKSLSSMGDYAGASIKNWWAWTWAWILSTKPARDLEFNDHETKLLGSHTWRHVFYKLRSQITRLIPNSTSYHTTLPQ